MLAFNKVYEADKAVELTSPQTCGHGRVLTVTSCLHRMSYPDMPDLFVACQAQTMGLPSRSSMS